jgi:diaminohydroxyphosphoribosylaminopyrimidine deaminase/5-amino-6-(5-phosphoribosylamino)uracil reductase
MLKTAIAEDEKFMQCALRLAKKGEGKTFPNPLVGACIVKHGRVIAEGYHARFGGPHAEVAALKPAGKAAFGATLYINLEPCVHYGKTPPCVDAIINAGVKRVVIAMVDPNPINHGKGISILKSAGIQVDLGLMQSQAEKLNQKFIDYIDKKT